MTFNFARPSFKSTLILTALVIAFSSHSAHAIDLCKEGRKSLNGDYEVLQSSGGLWGYMEKVSGLKDKSTSGLNADSKIQRAIVIFEDLCQTDKKPDQGMFDKIQKELAVAVAINSKPPGRASAVDISASIDTLNKNLDELLKTMEKK